MTNSPTRSRRRASTTPQFQTQEPVRTGVSRTHHPEVQQQGKGWGERARVALSSRDIENYATEFKKYSFFICSQWIMMMACTSVALLLTEGINVLTTTGAFISAITSMVSLPQQLQLKTQGSIKRRCFSAALIQFFALNFVLAAKACARAAGGSVDEMFAFFFYQSIFHPVKTKLEVGSVVDTSAAIKGFRVVLVHASAISLGLAILSALAARRTARLPLLWGLRRLTVCLCGIMIMAYVSKIFQDSLVWGLGCQPSYFSPPTLKMRNKPTVLVLTVNSLRADMLTADTFPKTLAELKGNIKKSTKGHGNSGSYCTQWKQHEASAMQSEQGFASFFYSMPSATYRHYLQFKSNKRIRSWPLQAFRSQGYHTHRMTSHPFTFCWGYMDSDCDLFTRDFDSIDQDTVNNNEKLFFDKAKNWIRDRKGKKNPFFFSLDLQQAGFPYRTDFAVGNSSFFEPSMNEKEIYLLKQELPNMDANAIDAARPKLVNSVKNSLLALDSILSDFLRDIKDERNNMVVILTGDHGELLLDGSQIQLSHGVDDTSDALRMVPLLMCGPSKVIQKLEIPKNIPTMHSQVLPAVISSLGATLGEEWLREPGVGSFFNSKRDPKVKAFAFARHPHSGNTVARLGNKRIVLRKGTKVIEATDLKTGKKLKARDIENVQNMVPRQEDYSWPGAEESCASDLDIDNYMTDDLELDEDASESSVPGQPLSETSNIKFVTNRDHILEVHRPTVQTMSTQTSASSNYTMDIISVGSRTRPHYMAAQQETWALHSMVRAFWGFMEESDFDESCADMSQEDVNEYINTCKERKRWGISLGHFVGSGYALSEGVRRHEASWICAQRRHGRAFGWIQEIYKARDLELPDFLFLTDDDTYANLVWVEDYLRRSIADISRPQMHGSCVFRDQGYVKWTFPYGGFGTIITRGSLQRLLQPIYCSNSTSGKTDRFTASVCRSIQRNRIQERAFFKEGYSVAEMFRDFHAQEHLCLHSDWILGYIANYYGLSERDSTEGKVHPIATWPFECGNYTFKCHEKSNFCHRMPPNAMEAFAKSVYNDSPGEFRNTPLLVKALNLSDSMDSPGAATKKKKKISLRSVVSRHYRNTILLATYVFGEDAANKGYLQMFIESARFSGVDVVIVGSPRPPFTLPDNVRHIEVTWEELVKRVNDKVFDGSGGSLERLMNAPYYKINDFKPLFAALFEEVVAGYTWWGWADNDLILGDMRHFLTDRILDRHDIISPSGSIEDGVQSRTWGPLTLFRNSDLSRDLFRLAQNSPEQIFNSDHPDFFDEWGQGGDYNSSMSGIVDRYAEKLGIRWSASYTPVGWDGPCKGQPRCAECTLVQPHRKGLRPMLTYAIAPGLETEVVLCHFLKSKDVIEESLKDSLVRKRIANAKVMTVSHPEGFHAPDPEPFLAVFGMRRLIWCGVLLLMLLGIFIRRRTSAFLSNFGLFATTVAL